MVQSANKIINMTRDEVEKAITDFPVAILPLGATEQHGHHLPLGVDIFLADHLAELVSEKTGAVVIPPMPFGYSWVWRDIPERSLFNNIMSKQLLKMSHTVFLAMVSKCLS